MKVDTGKHIAGLACCLAAAAACGPRQDGAGIAVPDPVGSEARPCHVAAAGPNMRATNVIEDSIGPVIAWNGQTFDIAWRDLRGQHPAIFALRVDKAGTVIEDERRIPGEESARDQSLAADAAEGHLVFMEQETAKSLRLGDEPREPVTVDDDVTAAAAGPAGVVVWAKRGNLLLRSDARLLPPDRSGRREEPPPALLGAGGIADPAVAWNGTTLAVVWTETAGGSKRVMLQRATLRGEKIGPALQVSVAGGVNRQPRVAWSGQDWAVVWTNEVRVPGKEQPRYRAFFSLVPEKSGAPRATHELAISSASERVALAATGSEFGVAWLENLDPMGSVVYFRRLSREGELLGSPLRISDGEPLNCGRPDLAWAGDGFGVAWHDDRDARGSEIFFSFLACGDEPQPDAGPAADAGAPDAGAAADEADDRPPPPELYTEEGEKKPR